MKLVQKFLKDESGATAIEYGLIAALISVAIIAGATALGSSVNDTFGSISDTLDTATGGTTTGGTTGGTTTGGTTGGTTTGG